MPEFRRRRDVYQRALAAGVRPEDEPRRAAWGERYFHLTIPDSHELSVARPLLRERSVPVEKMKEK
jgi:hypothetical protein